jgi:hypothetical protein
MADLITIPEGSIVYDISLDLHDLITGQVVRAKQYDTRTRYIRATIFNDGDLYPITPDKLISFSATKPDGYGIDNSAGIDADGKIIYMITDQTTAKDGVFDAEFRIYDTETISGITYSRRKTSFSFKMSVVKSALNDATVISSYEFNQLTELMGTVGDIVTDGTALILEMQVLIETGNTLINSMTELETTVESNEEIRIENEDARYKQFYVTQAQYNTLPQEDKDNPKYVYEITDNPDATLIATLTDLLNQINIALAAVEESTVDINNINDLIVTTIQTWSSSKIVSRIRNFKYTASSTVSSITHGLDYNSTTDDLQVYYNGLLLEEGVNFTNSTDFHTINLTSWTVSSGDRVYFKLYKYVK